MTPDEGAGRLRAYLDEWQVGMQLTTRGIQVGAGIPDLMLAEEAAEQLRAQGLLVMESIGATHLWRRREPDSTEAEVEIPPTLLSSAGPARATRRPTTLSVGQRPPHRAQIP